MKNSFDIVICGVGGQGILLASNIIGQASIEEDLPVKGIETHGMSQRGGSVEAHIRIGGIYGPKISSEKVDLLLSFEPLEGARYSYYLKKESFAVINTASIPLPGSSEPEISNLLEIVKQKTPNLIAENFTKIEYTNLGIPERNFPLVKEADGIIIISGQTGSLNEFTIAFHYGKVIGILQDSGGITSMIKEIAEICDKRGEIKNIVYSEDPKELVASVLNKLK